MPKYEISTSQFGLMSGTRQPVSDLITIAGPRTLFTPEARKGRLYIIVESDQDAAKGHQACQLVSRTIRKAFYADSSFSITSSLREAVRVANRVLYKHNFHAARNKRVLVGLTCAVLKERDLFLAQVAPSQAYVLAEGKLRALPTHPSWKSAHTSTAPFLKPSAMGASLSVDPELYRCLLQPEDSVLLCSSSMAHLLSATTVESLLHNPNPTDSVEYLYQLCVQDTITDAHAITIKLMPPLSPTARTKPVSRTGLSERGRLLVQTMGAWVAGLMGEAALATRKNRTNERQKETEKPDGTAGPPESQRYKDKEFDVRNPPPEQPDLPTFFAPKPLPIDLGESLTERLQHAESDVETLPPSTFLGEGERAISMPLPQEPIDLSDLTDTSMHAEPYRPRYKRRPLVDMSLGERLALPFTWVSSMLTDTFRSRSPGPSLPSSRLPARNHHLGTPPRQHHFPWPIFLLLILSVALAILYGISLSRRNADERILQYLDEAERRMGVVYQAADMDEAATRLDDAARALDEVRFSPLITVTNAAFWLRYQDIQSEYEQALSSIHRLSFLDDLEVIAEHPLPRGRFASVVVPPATLNVTDTNVLDALRYVYVLDGNSDASQLYRVPRDGGVPQPYLSPNDVVRDVLVGPLRAHAWRLDSVVVVDEESNGYGYYFRDGTDWNHIRLGGSEIWIPGARLDMETYEGNLYVWGAEANEILKFTSGRYSDIPQLWVEPTALAGRDLGTAIDMAIDGDIYLLQPNGTVLVLNLGRFEREIVPGEITPPVTTVTGFFITGTPEEGWVFLVDTLGERIIQIDKRTGAIIQQMQVRADSPIQLNQLTDVYVDVSTGRPMLYLVNGNQLLKSIVPVPPPPFELPSDTLGSLNTPGSVP